MRARWFLILGAIIAIVAVSVAARFWGVRASLGVFGLLALASWIAYTYSGSAMDRVYNEYQYSDDEMKKEFMASANAEIRAEIEKRERDEKKA